jgi:hypothetical protein
MKKFTAFLDAIGANYELTQYGEHYFPNAPELLYTAVCIRFSYQDARKETEVLKYLKRKKNLVIFAEWHNLTGFGFSVAEAADRENHLNYRVYMDASRHEWEEEAHKLYTVGHPERVNEVARAIMQKWEREYLKSFFQVVSA